MARALEIVFASLPPDTQVALVSQGISPHPNHVHLLRLMDSQGVLDDLVDSILDVFPPAAKDRLSARAHIVDSLDRLLVRSKSAPSYMDLSEAGRLIVDADLAERTTFSSSVSSASSLAAWRPRMSAQLPAMQQAELDKLRKLKWTDRLLDTLAPFAMQVPYMLRAMTYPRPMAASGASTGSAFSFGRTEDLGSLA